MSDVVLTVPSDVAIRIASALERIADQLEAREREDEPDLYQVRPVRPPRRAQRRDDERGR